FIEAALQAGVQEVVFMSALGADLRPADPLCQLGQHIAQSGGRYTILRANWVMQNVNTLGLRRINTNKEILLPSGNARLALIDTRDIAAVATQLLLHGVQPGQAYTLTGPEAFTYGEVAGRLSAIAGRTITHLSPTPESELQRLRERDVAPEH